MKRVGEKDKFYWLDFEEALEYFDTDAETLEFLESLTEDEKAHFNMIVHVYPEEKHVSYIYGHAFHASPNLVQVGNGVTNGVWDDDDFHGAIEKLQSMFGGEK